MPAFRTRSGAWAVAAAAFAAVWAAGLVAAEPEAKLLFYAPFESSVDAVHAAGSSKGAATPAPEFAPGRRGNALLAGDDAAQVAYQAAGNLDPRQGTLELWVKPVNWQGGDPQFHKFFEARPIGWLLLYTYKDGQLCWLAGGHDNKKYTSLFAKGAALGPDRWTLLTATWTPEELVLYVDGLEAGRRAVGAGIGDRTIGAFTIGDLPWVGDRPGGRKTLIDEVRIYDRAFTPEEVAAAFRESEAAGDPPVAREWVMPLPRLSTPPTLDDVFRPEEWTGAGECRWFTDIVTGRLSARQTVVYGGWHGERYYWCFRSPLPEAGLFAESRQRDADLWNEDSVEMLYGLPDGGWAQIIVNALGTTYEARNKDLAWNPEMSVASGQADGMWTLMLAIDAKEMGLPAPAGGGELRATFCRDWHSPNEHSAWPPSGYAKNPDLFPRFRLVGSDAPVVRLTGLGRPDVGLPVIQGEISGGGRASEVELRLAAGGIGAPAWLTETQRHPAAPGTTTAFSHAFELDETYRILRIEAVDAADDSALYRQDLPLSIASRLDVACEWLEAAGQVRVRIDLNGLRESWPAALAEVRLVDGKDNTLAFANVAQWDDHLLGVAELNVADLPAGRYPVRVRLLSEGVEVASAEGEFHKVFVPPPTGELKEPPPPWTPLKTEVEGDRITVECWGRSFHFRGDVFPERITALGRELLAGRAGMVGEIANGRDWRWTPKSLRVKSQSPVAVELEANGAFGPWPAAMTAKIEFDGLIYYAFSAKAASRQKFKRLASVLPLARERFTLALLPEYTRGRSGTLAVAPGERKGWPFFNYLWLGDEDTGLTWFAETNNGWTKLAANNPRQPLELAGQADAISFEANILVDAEARPGEFRVEFGWQPTPMKPMPPDRRQWRISRTLRIPWSGVGLQPYFGYPGNKVPGAYDQVVEECRKAGQRVAPYVNLTMLSEDAPEYKSFGKRWNIPGISDYAADVREFGAARIYGVCPAVPEFRAVMRERIREWVAENGFDGLYHDWSSPRLCNNKSHGCENRMPIRGWRELFKDAYVTLKSLNRPTAHIQHISWGLCTPIMSFSDAYLAGENTASIPGRDMLERVPLDKLRAEYTGRQFGLVNLYVTAIPHDRAAEEIPTDQAVMLALLHDIPGIWRHGLWISYDRLGRFWWPRMEAVGAFDDRTEFEPYWQKESRSVQVAAPLLVSAYRRGDGALAAVVFNPTAAEATAAVAAPDGSGWSDLATGEAVDIGAIRLAPRSGRLLAREAENR